MNTIKEAKDYLNENYKQGCECPVCGGKVKQYKRKLNSGMALFLIGLYKLIDWEHGEVTDTGFSSKGIMGFHTNEEVMQNMDMTAKGLDYGVLRHFKLAEPMMNINSPHKRNSGKWRLTTKGFMFVRGTIKAPKYAFIVNNKCRSLSSEEITLKEALGEGFDFDELMNS